MVILLFLINFVNFFKVLFADFPNTKFWFPEFFYSYAWHVTTQCQISSNVAYSFVLLTEEALTAFYSPQLQLL